MRSLAARQSGLLFLIMLIFSLSGNAQVKKKHSPNKAALYSAVIPGLGQVYNRKYWKTPVIYVGFGTFYYFIHANNVEYQKFKDAYDFVAGGRTDQSKHNSYADKYAESSLLDGRNYYRRNRDFSIILASAWYLLNVVDAAVDAYLFDYDVGDDLTIKLRPYSVPCGYSPGLVTGLSITLDFNHTGKTK
ncbi:MAG: DUF5683 domain-containing protein [Bacteroidetes bacterium]|nr:DUF5683 domain-containing protein [Bacteroidota bacterium]